MQAPIAPRHPVTTEQLGRHRTDDYAWMKDPNWQAVLRDPAVLRADIREHLVAENAYTEAVLAETAGLQQTLFDEMVGRIRADDSTVPSLDGAWAYSRRYAAGAQHPLLVRVPASGGDEEVLLDVDAMAKPHTYFRLAGAEHSADHRRFAWAEDRQGSEVYTVHVIDLETRAALGAEIESCTGNFVFSPCGRHLFWTLRDDNGRPSAVFRRPVGGSAADDVLVFREADAGFFLGVSVASSREWIVLSMGNQETSEAWIVPAADPTTAPQLVAAREAGVRYDVDHWGDQFVIRTNAEALDYRLMTALLDDLSRAGWRDLVPHVAGRFITGFALFARYLVHVERVDALDRIVITDRATGEARPLAVDEEAYCLSVVGGYEYDTVTLRYAYDSPREPRQVFDVDMSAGDMAYGSRVLRKTQEIPSGHDPAAYVVRRVQATAPDGVLVPMTLLARRDAFEAGACPVLLYGYGSYGISSMPHFSIQALNLVERGWIWATAHVRGGSEKGWGWFLDGRGAQKPNTFSDFTACADHLVAAGHAETGRIVAYGGSAGGLLVGAVLNQRPELWAGVAAAVPFVDVLNTMSDTSLPLTPPEWPEWGNPLEDAGAYDLIASYSPYDQVAARAYPPVLALGGLSDPRVTYWEPAKWVSKLRAHMTGDAPILLRMNMEAGHGGRSGRYEYLREPALVQAFALWAMARAGG